MPWVTAYVSPALGKRVGTEREGGGWLPATPMPNELWFPGAIRLPAPSWKVGYSYPNDLSERTGKGALVHSMEGRWQDAYSRLASTAQVSWHFSVTYEGIIQQFYPLTAICWHGGGPYVNCRWFGIETEGRVGEPLTPSQTDSVTNILWWASRQESWPYFRHEKDTGTLQEHRWHSATACPSGRIPFAAIVERLNAMATEDNIRIIQLKFMDLILDRDWVGLRNLLAWLGAQA